MRATINMIDEIKRDILKIYYENEAVCESCGLVYEAKYNRNESINYFKALE